MSFLTRILLTTLLASIDLRNGEKHKYEENGLVVESQTLIANLLSYLPFWKYG